MFLTPAELHKLTGAKWRSRQKQWLRENGFRYIVNLHGEVLVMTAEVQAQLVTNDATGAQSSPRWEQVA